MLVGAALGPDSRVIKQARSIADNGWDLTILAASNTLEPDQLPGVTVRVVPEGGRVPHAGGHRSLRLRAPLGYSATGTADRRFGRAEFKLLDIRSSIDRERSSPSPATGLRIGFMRLRALGTKGRIAVVRKRAAMTHHAAMKRRLASGSIDKAVTRLWSATQGDRSWRRLWPQAWNHEHRWGPLLDQLEPDIIQANDFAMLGVGARAKLRLQARGLKTSLIWDAREFLPGMSPWNPHPRWHLSQMALEREYAPVADFVVTVSEPLAELLVKEHDLAEMPAVVTNAPDVQSPPVECPTDVRTECGLDASVPLVAYSGAAAPQRGLEVLIDVLPSLPSVHLALVVRPPHIPEITPYVGSLIDRAKDLGVSDRVHVLPYVPSAQVVSFLSTATLGVFPGLPFLNHTISLITKFMEYSHARLPIVVSELKMMADTVRATGQGEVFEPENVESLRIALEQVIADPDRYRKAYEDRDLLESWTWGPQADVLDTVYARAAASISRNG
ncbi:hypothetical protein ASD81_19800 [Nocardioides sp. Root614]|nr:hypothetical protein ASD81_19800 [Nocardioides sp. Root614]KRA86865.1 hypothetical protein ASD84_22015 [Nocardioides sp. Root682]